MNFAAGAARYMMEVGNYHRHALTTLGSLEWLEAQLGANKRLIDISDEDVARIVAARRVQMRRVGRVENQTKRVSAATVNRTATEPLRKVLTRARKVWKLPTLEIDWSQHMLKEPKERVREASVGEERAVMAPLERGYEDATNLMFRDGLRRMEVIGLIWSRVDFFGKQYTVVGKGGKSRTIPMSDNTFALFWSLKGRDPHHVFTFVALKTRVELKQVRGVRYPVTEHGLRSAQRRAIADSGVQNFRPHDIRHTAATRVLRASNLRVAQKLLGHEDVATTAKYAHALAEDVRAALNATSPSKRPSNQEAVSDKALGDLREAG